MCGFLGQFDTKSKCIDAQLLNNLLTLSTHRGPDEQKSWMSEKGEIWLGFNRLAIQELSSAGSQPMHNVNQTLSLVFNGEIYNHLELRQHFPNRVWRGNSDTETILACIEHWGFEQTLKQLDGMFAIVCYHHEENTLYCARDFAGIKPFFYGWNGNSFVFSSQYDQISTHPLFNDNPIDPEVLLLYLEQHYMPAPFGLIKNTGQLKPGEWMKIHNGFIQKKIYWEFPDYYEANIFDEKTALELLENKLNQSVQAQMISDVPLGGFLSGGIDSPLVCYFATKHSKQPFQTFTIGSNSKIHDESSDAMTYARWLNANSTLEKMDRVTMQNHLEAILNHTHEPIGDFSIIPTYFVSKLAREKVTVALSGDGGDELFYGYERFGSVAKNIHFQHFPYLLKAMIYKSDKIIFKNKWVNSGLLISKQATSHRGLHNRFQRQWINALFPDLQNVHTPKDYNIYNYPNTRNELNLLQNMRKAEFYGMMQKTLRKVDLASMAVSLEVRVPFLSKSMIETSLIIDTYLSYGKGKKKNLLKNLLINKFPKAPINNQKRGFTVPLNEWLNEGQFVRNIENNILQNGLVEKFGLSTKALSNLFIEQQKGHNLKWPIFTLMTLR